MTPQNDTSTRCDARGDISWLGSCQLPAGHDGYHVASAGGTSSSWPLMEKKS
jgi:hypothetical protein